MPDATQKKSVFISYAREDKAHAHALADFLTAKGHEVWWDHLIRPGDDYRNEILNKIQDADKLIVLWTSHSVKSPFVIDEAQRANEAQKLIPVVMDVSQPPMGFGHLHAVEVADLSSEFPAILAAVEDRAPPSLRENLKTIQVQRYFLAAIAGLIAVAAVGLGIWFFANQTTDLTADLNPAMDYQVYTSEKLGLKFVYPQSALMADTTKEDEGLIPLHTAYRDVEVLVSRRPLPDHNNIRIGRRLEKEALEQQGYNFNYIGPSKEKNWKDWYILTGEKPNGHEFYYRRWYTDKDVVSIEFDYPKEKVGAYNEIIGAMTLDGRFQFR